MLLDFSEADLVISYRCVRLLSGSGLFVPPRCRLSGCRLFVTFRCLAGAALCAPFPCVCSSPTRHICFSCRSPAFLPGCVYLVPPLADSLTAVCRCVASLGAREGRGERGRCPAGAPRSPLLLAGAPRLVRLERCAAVHLGCDGCAAFVSAARGAPPFAAEVSECDDHWRSDSHGVHAVHVLYMCMSDSLPDSPGVNLHTRTDTNAQKPALKVECLLTSAIWSYGHEAEVYIFLNLPFPSNPKENSSIRCILSTPEQNLL